MNKLNRRKFFSAAAALTARIALTATTISAKSHIKRAPNDIFGALLLRLIELSRILLNHSSFFVQALKMRFFLVQAFLNHRLSNLSKEFR